MSKFKSSDDTWNTIGSIMLLVVLFLVIFIPASIYFILVGGFVFTKLWLWFVVPLGIPAVKLIHAAGIMTLIRLVTYKADNTKQEEDEETSMKVLRIVGLLLVPWFALMLGAILHSFM